MEKSVESQMIPKSTLIMPLYIYPLSVISWAKLYDSMATHPNLSFCIIVNPNSGPGDKPLPGEDYEREVPKLVAHGNCHAVGYVRTDYCRRPLADVCKDIEVYSNWPANSNNELYVEGIFLDETPNLYTEERAEYLQAVRRFIKRQDGIMGSRLVIENPGTPPDAELVENGPDITVTSELSYDRLISDEVQEYYRIKELDRARSCYMVNAILKDQITQAVRDFRGKAAYVFATDLKERFYESFGDSWEDFVAALDE